MQDRLSASTSHSVQPDMQYLLVFGDEYSPEYKNALSLKQKWDKQHPQQPAQIILQENFLDKKEFSKIVGEINRYPTSNIKFYIMAHGDVGEDYVKDSYGNNVTLDQVKTIAATLIGSHSAELNLIVCQAGRSQTDNVLEDNSMNSFASQLHLAVAESTGRQNIPVVARMQLVAVAPAVVASNIVAGRKSTPDLSVSPNDTSRMGPFTLDKILVHRQPGSKVRFEFNDQGQQIRIDSYFHDWKDRVLKVLKRTRDHTKVKEKQAAISQWLNDFPAKTEDEIYHFLKAEINDSNSILKTHSNPIAKFFKEADAFKTLRELVNERQRILDSPYTHRDVVLTGRSFKKS